jgi:hypothetical protein
MRKDGWHWWTLLAAKQLPDGQHIEFLLDRAKHKLTGRCPAREAAARYRFPISS